MRRCCESVDCFTIPPSLPPSLPPCLPPYRGQVLSQALPSVRHCFPKEGDGLPLLPEPVDDLEGGREGGRQGGREG